jgi:hypothetical protein
MRRIGPKRLTIQYTDRKIEELTRKDTSAIDSLTIKRFLRNHFKN